MVRGRTTRRSSWPQVWREQVADRTSRPGAGSRPTCGVARLDVAPWSLALEPLLQPHCHGDLMVSRCLPHAPLTYSRAHMNVGHRNHVHAAGDGPLPMFFAHGFGCDQNMWRLLAPHYAKRFRTVCFDHVGSGGSALGAFIPAQSS